MIRRLPWLRWVAAWFAFEGTWLFACEAWRQQQPTFLLEVTLVATPLFAIAWHAFAAPRRALFAALCLAGALIANDELLDLLSPYPRRFGLLDWELVRTAPLVAGFWVGERLAAVRELPRWWRITARVVCGLSIASALLVPMTMTYLALDGSRDDTEQADAALVLGFALADDGTAQPQLVGRMEHAIDLVKRGVVPRLLLSGGVGKAGHTEARVMRDLATAAGVPADELLLDEDARSTVENFACARPLLEKLGAHRVLVVTEPWHMTRAMLLARRHGLPAIQSPASSAIWRSPRHAAYWVFRDAVAYIRERTRDPFASPGVCRARECEGCRKF
jgi:uncharacterized SAM-binding protein YcdF (DUF218 family)